MELERKKERNCLGHSEHAAGTLRVLPLDRTMGAST